MLEANTRYTALEILEGIQAVFGLGEETLKAKEVFGKYSVRIGGVVANKAEHIVKLNEGSIVVVVGSNRFDVEVGPDEGKVYKSEAAKPVIKAQGQEASKKAAALQAAKKEASK